MSKALIDSSETSHHPPLSVHTIYPLSWPPHPSAAASQQLPSSALQYQYVEATETHTQHSWICLYMMHILLLGRQSSSTYRNTTARVWFRNILLFLMLKWTSALVILRNKHKHSLKLQLAPTYHSFKYSYAIFSLPKICFNAILLG